MPSKTSTSIYYFTRKDRRGYLLLMTAVSLACMFPFLYPLFAKNDIVQNNSLDSSLAVLSSRPPAKKQSKYNTDRQDDYQPYNHPSSSNYTSYKRSPQGTLFNFDPNTISAEGWKKLGLRDKTIATILNFRNKGGKFREAADIKKIWGLFPDEAERLMPYVSIAASSSESPERNYSNDFSKAKKYESRSYSPVDINNSDTTAWVALPGIGSKLSQRIINFRNRLGGFYAVSQVGETFGLPDSTFQKIKPLLQLDGEVKKINLNVATLDELKMHPYIKYHLANALVQFRTQHGNYQSVEDIRKIMILTEDNFQKLKPYLAVE